MKFTCIIDCILVYDCYDWGLMLLVVLLCFTVFDTQCFLICLCHFLRKIYYIACIPKGHNKTWKLLQFLLFLYTPWRKHVKVTSFGRVTFSYSATRWHLTLGYISKLPGEIISLPVLCAAIIWCPGISN